ncbi:Leucine-binding protein domain [Trypanosoma melophagium]|uniref:Leucine-binding protein domain n=1 Tax=Trypanosoma melophagium TaxID=715481 RepID=UPI00351A7396|nr:Leucine-binding protein domain [Trypanosoma melophagium]
MNRKCTTLLSGTALFVIVVALATVSTVVMGQTAAVKLLDMVYTNNPAEESSINAYKAGIRAALWSRNDTVSGKKVEFIETRPGSTETEVHAAINETMTRNPDILAVIGPADDNTLQYALPVLEQYHLVALGPYTAGSAVRVWEPHYYFFRSGPMSGLYAHVWYAVAHLRVRRLGYMYLSDVSYGDIEYTAAVSLMEGMGLELCGAFTLPGTKEWDKDDSEFQAEWEKFAATRPQSVIIFGKPSKTTAAFIQMMLSDSRVNTAYLQSPFGTQSMLISSWKDAVDAGIPFVPGRVITTGTNPLPSDLRYEAIKRFQTVMGDYLENSSQSEYPKDPKYFLEDDVIGETMVCGWIAGEIIVQALGSVDGTADRHDFEESLFKQRRYVVEDLVIGDFGGECVGRAESQGAVCECNQGGRTVLIKIFGENFKAEVMLDAEFSFPLADCYPTSTAMLTPASVLTFVVNNSRRGRYATEEMQKGAYAALPPYFERARDFTMSSLYGTRGDFKDALIAEIEVRLVDIFVGVVVPAALEVEGVIFVDPIGVDAMMHLARRDVIYLSSTLNQEYFLEAEYISKQPEEPIHAVILGLFPEDIHELLRRTLLTFDLHLSSVTYLYPDDSIIAVMPTEGWVFVVGIDTDEALPLHQFVVDHPKLRIFIPSSEQHVMFMYLKALNVDSGTDRIFFATNIPHWNDPNPTQSVVKDYQEAFPDPSDRSPLSITSFVAYNVIMTVAARMDKMSPELFIHSLYAYMVFSLDDLVYGPFKENTEGGCTDTSDSKCLVNYGATHISIWSLSRTLDPTVPTITPPSTPTMEYTEPVKENMPIQKLAGIIGGSVAAGLLLIGFLLFFLCRPQSARDNANAPKEPTDPVTLVFTDIESSTALWAACPEIMPDAVATHHRLIRALIAKYRCYEVKTIGDSFMIASRSVFAAVQLVRELQQSFLHHDWGTGAIDDAYHEFEEGKAAEDDEYVPPTARLDAAVYRQYWNGVRVRAGMHTGLADIRHDEVTKGYDYYGSTSNTAARTESVANGGQVLLTRAAYMALSTAEREQVDVTALGPVALRGVPKPVEMYQLDAVPGRTFAALRLDREFIDFDESGSESQSVSSSSKNESISSSSNPLVILLTDLFAPLPQQQRLKVLQMIGERWNISVPSSKSNSAKQASEETIARLAMKLNRVLTRKAELMKGEQGVGEGTFIGSIASSGTNRRSVISVTFDETVDLDRRRRSRLRSTMERNSLSTSMIESRPPPGFFFS